MKTISTIRLKGPYRLPSEMNVIVNVSPEWGIGFENKLLVHVHADMRRFRALTQGNTVVYGRNTLLTFPNGNPLPKRRNIVLTHERSFQKDGLIVCHDLNELQAVLSDIDPDTVFLCGGQQTYQQLLPYCKTAYVTLTETNCKADRFFPNLNRMQNWTLTDCGERQEEDGVVFRFLTYRNKDFS